MPSLRHPPCTMVAHIHPDLMKAPRKTLIRVIREYGGTLHEKGPYGDTYIFEDNYRLFVAHQERTTDAVSKLGGLRHRYGPTTSTQLAGLTNRPRKPVLDLNRLVASGHAKERLTLMKRQAGVEFTEVVLCLRAPERIMWAPDHEAWVWVGGRLAVPIKETSDGFLITTVLWSTNDLFAAHPRPEKREAS